jgi:peptide deformylase
MTVRLVTTIGDPVLREKSRPVDPGELASETMQSLVDDLIETMRHYRGAGLAAPQVMAPVRVVTIEVNANPRYPYKPDIPLTVLINPEIEALDDETFDNYEGCLSVPGLRGVTRRLVQIGVRALDRHGRPFEREVRGLSAVTYQHEVDHLDGRLFVDLVTDPSTLATWEQFERYHLAGFSARAKELVARFGA